MKQVLLPDDMRHPLPFYLAMEEFLADRDKCDYFFIWQVDPTVIIGRNQLMNSEVNLDYCRAHGIDVVRRKSGGGCVFADSKNLMFSYITTTGAVTTTFAQYTEKVAAMLRTLGIDAQTGGRNDVLIEGRKVSGNAFYNRRGRAIVHGTMLFDTDIETMVRAITPSVTKLISKGVKSVRSRVINLSDVTTMSINDFKKRAADFMCDSTLTLTAADVEHIERIAKNYTDPKWLTGNSPDATVINNCHIEGVGEFYVSLSLAAGRVKDVQISGDYFPLSDVDDALLDKLHGAEYTPSGIAQALKGVDVSKIIASLSNEQFIKLII